MNATTLTLPASPDRLRMLCGSAPAEVAALVADALADDGQRLRRVLRSYRLTPTQIEIADTFWDLLRRGGSGPTMQELADAMKVSKVTIFEHVSRMEERGVLVRERYQARSLRFAPAIAVELGME